MLVKIKKIGNGKLPTYQREGDSCLDCYSAENTKIEKGTRKLVKLGFALDLPDNYEAVIRPRSGLSKKGIDNAIGTIDSNYRGELMVNIINNSDKDFDVNYGDRVCQLAIRMIEKIEWIEVDELSDSNRGSNGFGSSGVN